MTIYVGLDLSLVSPGVAIYDGISEVWLLYGFAQRIRERGLTKRLQNTTIHILPAIPNSPTTTNEERYEHIRHQIIDTILSPYANETDVLIGIESYAFGTRNSGSSYKLQELGGVVKHSIWKHYPLWRRESIPPTKWTKHTLGNGRSTKADVIEYVRTNGPRVPLLDLLGLVPTQKGEIPCPAQDLADAACICLSFVPTITPGDKKRRRDSDDEPTTFVYTPDIRNPHCHARTRST